jgi:chromosome segregation ATPase
MTDASAIEAATKRLSAALDALEAALEHRRDTDRGENALAAQVHALGTDRSKLASDLDAVTARARRLEAANREIAQRIDTAMENIRSVVETRQ